MELLGGFRRLPAKAARPVLAPRAALPQPDALLPSIPALTARGRRSRQRKQNPGGGGAGPEQGRAQAPGPRSSGLAPRRLCSSPVTPSPTSTSHSFFLLTPCHLLPRASACLLLSPGLLRSPGGLLAMRKGKEGARPLSRLRCPPHPLPGPAVLWGLQMPKQVVASCRPHGGQPRGSS